MHGETPTPNQNEWACTVAVASDYALRTCAYVSLLHLVNKYQYFTHTSQCDHIPLYYV